MITEKITEIDALILKEKMSIALEHFADAWDNAMAEGIDPELMAQTMICNALTELASMRGDNEASKIICTVRSMEANGEFLLDKTIQ